MSEKISLARLKKFGKTFEIRVDPEAALAYKKGEISELDDVLLAEKIFTDAHKGYVASQEELNKVFNTIDFSEIADNIVKHGEIQLTSEHRSAEREKRHRRLIEMIHKQAVDPKTGLPHPPQRIEAALEQGKIHLDDHRSGEEQFEEIISRLRPLIPLKIEQKQVKIEVPAQYTGRAYPIIRKMVKILQEEWTNQGNWQATIELPAGLYPEFIDKLNSLTQGKGMIFER